MLQLGGTPSPPTPLLNRPPTNGQSTNTILFDTQLATRAIAIFPGATKPAIVIDVILIMTSLAPRPALWTYVRTDILPRLIYRDGAIIATALKTVKEQKIQILTAKKVKHSKNINNVTVY